MIIFVIMVKLLKNLEYNLCDKKIGLCLVNGLLCIDVIGEYYMIVCDYVGFIVEEVCDFYQGEYCVIWVEIV